MCELWVSTGVGSQEERENSTGQVSFGSGGKLSSSVVGD